MRQGSARRLFSLARGAIPDGIATPGGEVCARRGPRSATRSVVARLVLLSGACGLAACGKSPAPSGGG